MTKATAVRGGIIEQILLALYQAEDTVGAIDAVLALLGEAFDVSRVCIFEDSEDGAWRRNTFEWCAPGIAPQKDALQNEPYSFTDGKNDFYRPFDADGVFYCPDVSALSEAERAALCPGQARSLLRCALMDGGERRGFVGFDECRSCCAWPKKQVEALCLAAKIVGIFLLKARSEAEASFSSDFRAALDNSASYVYIVDPDTYEILHCNCKICQHSGKEPSGRCYEAFMGLDAPCAVCPVKALGDSGESVSVEMLRPDGLWLVSQASPMRWHGRRMMMVTCTDVTRQKQAEVVLREREDENAIVVRQSGKYILRYDVRTKLGQNYAEAAAMFQIPEAMEDYPESLFPLGVVAADSVEPFRAFFRSMREGVQSGALNTQLRLASGQYRWFHADYTLIGDSAGLPSHAIVSFSDCTELLEKELAYEKLQNDLSLLITESVSFLEGNLSKDTVERIVGLRGDGVAILPGETYLSRLLAEDCEKNIAPEDRAQFSSFYDQQRLLSLCARNVFRDSFDFRSAVTGEPRWYHSDVQLARYPYSSDVKIFIILTDVTERLREREHLEALAYRDSMTRLLNRDTTESRIRQALADCREDDVSALFMIDLDNFKQVNDTRGHQAGDEALRNIARAIAEVFRGEDVVGRIGGDEFIAFVARGASRSLVSKKAAALVEELQFSVGDFVVTASVGVSMGAGGSKSFDQLYSEADKALYVAKRRGKSQFSIAPDAMAGAATAPTAGGASAAIQFKSLLENMDGGVVLASVGKDVTFTYVSPSFFRSMGRSETEAGKNGERLTELILPEDLPLVLAAVHRAAAGEVTDCVYRVRGEQDAWRQLRVARLTAAAGQEGVPVIGVITDITDLKRTETNLRVAEERYRLAIQQTGGLIWEVDIPSRTLYQSEQVSQAFGRTGTVFPDAPESVLRLGVIHPDSAEEYRRIFADIYAGREGGTYTLLAGSEASGYFWTRATFRLIRDDAGVPCRAIGVSEKLTNVEPEMRVFNGELRFFDLTAPSLYGAVYANLSQDKVEKFTLPERAGAPATYTALYALRRTCISNEDLDAVSAAMSRENLLASFQNGQSWLFTEYRRKAEAGGGERWINLSANLLRHPVSGDIFAFLFFRDVTMRRGWETALSANTPIERDSATVLYVRETLSAMAEAAVKQLSPGGRCFMTVFTLSGFEKLRAEQGLQSVQRLLFTLGRLFRIVVEGTVVAGVLDETHFCVFRVGEISSEQQRDSIERCRERILMLLAQTMPGLSLTILCGYTVAAKEQASFERMVHQAIVASDASLHRPGTPVTLYADPHAAAQDSALQAAEREILRHILVADDDPITRALLKKIFGAAYAVDTASDGEEALAMIRARDYAIVISDIHMPKKSGWDVLETMKADRALSKIPVVIITSDTDEESEVKALTLGAEDVIVKPFMAKTMQSRVANIIGRYESARTSEQTRLYELRFQQQAYLLRLAEHDELTGLYNRQAFYRRVRARLDENRSTRYMILRWDIDDFKMLNDALGVETGDRLLMDVARYMREHCGRESVYARIEADHFADFFPVGLRAPEDVFRDLSNWFASYPLDFKITTRMGVFYVDEPGIDVRIMCDRALLALRSVKGSFSSRIGYYDDALRSRMLEEQTLSAEMVPALRDGQFRVYFQPQYNYDTGEMVGAEALVRWAHPTRGLLPPSVFVPLFERNGFISSLDEYVWEESCRYMRRWQDQVHKCLPVSVSVNISRIDIYNPHLTEKLLALVKKYRLEPSMLRLEITESAYMQMPEQLIAMVRSLQSMGFTVEMDDFGVGYSALATLKDVPVDILKLDMRFLSSGVDDARGGNLLSSVIRMAHWLKLPIIAEGVETAAQAEYLKSLNCFYMQGYFFGKPMPAEAFETLLHSVRVGSTDRYRSISIEGMAAFWDPAAQSTLLFNSFLGGAAIAEYRGGNVEIVRTNDRFFEAIGVPRAAYVEHVTRVLEDVLPDSRTRLLEALETAIRTGKDSECEVAFRIPDGSEHGRFRCIRTIARPLAQNGASYLLYLAIEDVTDRRIAERREQEQAETLRAMRRAADAEEARDRLVAEYLGALIFDYDFDADTLCYELHQPGTGAVSRTIRRYLEYLPGSAVVHPDYDAPCRAVFLEAQKTPVRGTFDYIADNFGTGFRWCRAHYASVADESGRVYRLVGVVLDIQQEKDREQRKKKA